MSLLGFTRFIFTDIDDGSNTELNLAIGTEYAGLELGAAVYWNIDADDGDSSVVFPSETSTMSLPLVTVTMSAIPWGVSAGVELLHSSISKRDSGSFAHTTVTLGASYAASENISISPYVAYAIGADEDYTGDDDGDFFGGVSVGYSF